MLTQFVTRRFGDGPYPDEMALIFNSLGVLSYADTALSGVPKVLRFAARGNYYYVKCYPTAGAEASGSGDDSVTNLYLCNDAEVSGTPRVFTLSSGGLSYKFKTYPDIASPVRSGGNISLPLAFDLDEDVSGSPPRVAKAEIDGVAYYWKIYPIA